MSRELVMFPDELQELNEELLHHPELQELLQQQPGTEFEVRLATIAAYCEVILDDLYSPEDLLKIAKLCKNKLYQKRNKGIIFIN